MEKIGSDIIIKIMYEIDGEDILAMSQTCKKMNEICFGERGQMLWKSKLRKEYNIITHDSKHDCEEFLKNRNLCKIRFYIISISKINSDGTVPNIFVSKETAIDYAVKIIQSENYMIDNLSPSSDDEDYEDILEEKKRIKDKNIIHNYFEIKWRLSLFGCYKTEYHMFILNEIRIFKPSEIKIISPKEMSNQIEEEIREFFKL